MHNFKSWVTLLILTTSSLTALASSGDDFGDQTSQSSSWSRTIPKPPAGGRQYWYTVTFQNWLAQEKQKGNKYVEVFKGNNLMQDVPLFTAYEQKFKDDDATQAKVAAASAESERRLVAEKTQLLQQLAAAERRRSIEENACQDAERARVEHEKRQRELAAEKQALELQHQRELEAARQLSRKREQERQKEEQERKAAEEAHRQALEKQRKLEEDKRIAEESRKQEELKHKAELEAHRQTRERVKLSEQKFNALVKKAREFGIDPSILDAVLPATDILEEELKGLGEKSRSLPHLMQWYIELLKEVKANENAAEQIKKDYKSTAVAVFSGSAILLTEATKIEAAVNETRSIYELARRHKGTLPSTFEEFTQLALRRIKNSNDFEEFMMTNLLTPLSDALERLDGKDSLQMSLDANEEFESFLKKLPQKGFYQQELITPITHKINESNKKIQAEIIKRNRALYEQFKPVLMIEANRIKNPTLERTLSEIPLMILLTCFHPAGFLLVNTNPSIDDLKEDLPTLTLNQLKALFAYFFGLADDFGGVLQFFSQRSHTPTKVKEADIQQLLSIVKTRVHQAEKDENYQPDPYKLSSGKKENISAFLKKIEDFVSGKTYRDTIQRRFSGIYEPLRGYITSCRQTDLEEFKLEVLSQRGAKGPIEETAAEQETRKALIDKIIDFQRRFSAMGDGLTNEQLTDYTKQFSEIYAAIMANGERFKNNFTAFLKRKDSNFVVPTIVIRPSPTPSPPSSSASSRSISPPTTPPAAPPAPSLDMSAPPPPGPPPSATVAPVTSSSSAPDRTKLLGELQGANIPTRLIEFARTLNPTQKVKWAKLDKKAKVLWMESGNEP